MFDGYINEDDCDESIEVIIKFVFPGDQYSAFAHEEAAKGGFGPKLVSFARFPLYDVYVSEKIKNGMPYHDLEATTKRRALTLLERHVHNMHEKDIVHGDVRSCNIIVHTQESEPRVFLIDFDYSGKVGETRYHDTRMNPAILFDNAPSKKGDNFFIAQLKMELDEELENAGTINLAGKE